MSLNSGMLRLLLVTTLVTLGSCGNGSQTNEEWKCTDKVVTDIDILYDNLAHTVADSSNKQKRAFSIMYVGLLNFVATGGDGNAAVEVSEPADVIAAEGRTHLDAVRTVLDPVINIIKRACPPKASAKECSKALADEEQKQMEMCEGFAEHLRFFKATEELVCNESYQKWIDDMVKVSQEEDDTKALQFINDMEEGKIYKDVTSKLLKWYSEYSEGDYPCNLPPGSCKSDSTNDCFN